MAIARERVGSRVVVVVVGLSIVRPTTKQWGKVEVGLGFGNSELFGTSVPTSQECLQKFQIDILTKTGDIPIFVQFQQGSKLKD